MKNEGGEMPRCPDCNTEMKLIDTCCKAGMTCNTTHFLLETPYFKCPKCKIEIDKDDLE